MIKTLTNHRSIRNYTSDKIDEQTLTALLEAACRASNTGNMQTYSIIVTTDEKIKEALAPCHFNQKMVTQAPAVITFCADFNRFNKWCQQRNAVPGYDNFLSFSSGMIDATIAAQNFCIAAESKGLGICYLGTTTYTAKKIIEILKLPKFVVPITTVTIGYPNEMPEQEDRLPLDGVVHYETYKDYSPTDIDRIYKEKESTERYKQFVTENNKETLAQVFTDVRYSKANNEHFSKELLAVLKEQGFWK
jgi:nitroreductase